MTEERETKERAYRDPGAGPNWKTYVASPDKARAALTVRLLSDRHPSNKASAAPKAEAALSGDAEPNLSSPTLDGASLHREVIRNPSAGTAPGQQRRGGQTASSDPSGQDKTSDTPHPQRAADEVRQRGHPTPTTLPSELLPTSIPSNGFLPSHGGSLPSSAHPSPASDEDLNAMVVLGIVGSRQFAVASEDVRTRVYLIIQREIEHLRPVAIVSGGAVGVDSMATEVALGLGYVMAEDLDLVDVTTPRIREFLPTVHNKYGYLERDRKIARHVTHLVAIRHPRSRTQGAAYTAKMAEENGAAVKRFLLSDG